MRAVGEAPEHRRRELTGAEVGGLQPSLDCGLCPARTPRHPRRALARRCRPREAPSALPSAGRARCGRSSARRRGDRPRAGSPGPRGPDASSENGSPWTSTPRALTWSGRSTSTITPGRLRQPSSAVARSSERHSISGLTRTVGSASEPTWKTSIRRSVPSWVAARPTPIASRIRPIIRSGLRGQVVVELRHRGGRGPEHRVSELDDLRQRRGTTLERLLVDALGLAGLDGLLVRRAPRRAWVCLPRSCFRV